MDVVDRDKEMRIDKARLLETQARSMEVDKVEDDEMEIDDSDISSTP